MQHMVMYRRSLRAVVMAGRYTYRVLTQSVYRPPRPPLESDGTVPYAACIQCDLLKMKHLWLETCRGM